MDDVSKIVSFSLDAENADFSLPSPSFSCKVFVYMYGF